MDRDFSFSAMLVPAASRAESLKGKGSVSGSVVVSSQTIGVRTETAQQIVNNYITNNYTTESETQIHKIAINDLLSLAPEDIDPTGVYLVFSFGSEESGWSEGGTFVYNGESYGDGTYMQWSVRSWQVLDPATVDMSKTMQMNPLQDKIGIISQLGSETAFPILRGAGVGGIQIAKVKLYKQKNGVYVEDSVTQDGRSTNEYVLTIPYATSVTVGDATTYSGGLLTDADYKLLKTQGGGSSVSITIDTSIGSSSTDYNVPSSKCVYSNINTLAVSIDTLSQNAATKEWVQQQNFLTEHQSLDGYAAQTWVQNGFLSLSGGTITVPSEGASALTINNTKSTRSYIEFTFNRGESGSLEADANDEHPHWWYGDTMYQLAFVSDVSGCYKKPSGGIPKSDLSSAVQSSLDKADSALQSHQDISGKLNVDGSNGTHEGVSALINKLPVGSSTPQDDDYYVSQYAGGAQSTYNRRPMSALWSYIKAKVEALGYTKNNGTITEIKRNGTSIATSGMANISVPTKTSELTNDSNFATETWVTNKGYVTSTTLTTELDKKENKRQRWIVGQQSTWKSGYQVIAVLSMSLDVNRDYEYVIRITGIHTSAQYSNLIYVGGRCSSTSMGTPSKFEYLLGSSVSISARLYEVDENHIALAIKRTSQFARYSCEVIDVQGYGSPQVEAVVNGDSYADDAIYLKEISRSIALTSDIPTNISQLNNDAGYLTEHQSLAAYSKRIALRYQNNYDGSITLIDKKGANGVSSSSVSFHVVTIDGCTSVTDYINFIKTHRCHIYYTRGDAGDKYHQKEGAVHYMKADNTTSGVTLQVNIDMSVAYLSPTQDYPTTLHIVFDELI